MTRSNFFPVAALISLYLGGQAVNAQFSIYTTTQLDNSLGAGCTEALTATVDCVPFVKSFAQLSYRSDLDLDLTNSICTAGCTSSLKTWFDSVSASCAGKSIRGAIPTKIGGYMWAGWNETCAKDPKPPRQYCNDIIAKFTLVPNIESMPRAELCHTCHVRRLAMMQSSQYSIYDEVYKKELEYVYAQCGLTGPTDIPLSLEKVQPAPLPYCLTGKRYTTKEGDTCESIAKSNSVSAAGLYMGNQDLIKDCANVITGVSVCIPMTCITYQVQEADTCFTIERAQELESGVLLKYNSWLDAGCTNLLSATGFYGNSICASPQGGTFVNPTTPVVPGATPNPSDGYSNRKVSPPEGAVVAQGTTMECGKWHVVTAEDFCVKICLTNGIDATLFHQVNPSLGDSTACDASLKAKTALCVGPMYGWKSAAPSTSSA